jgi:hypothetical protein
LGEEAYVILSHSSLSFKDLNENHGLVVGGGREDLALLGRDSGTALDEVGHDTASGLDTKSKRVDIHEDDLLGLLLAGKNTTLNGGAVSDSLIRVDTLGSLLSEELLEHSLDLGNTGGATDKNDVVDVALLELRILQDLLNRLEGLLEKIVVQLLELGAGKSLGHVVALVEGLDFDLGAHLAGESALGLLDLTLQLGHGLDVLGDVGVHLLVVGLGQVVDNTLVKVLTTEVSVTGGSLDLEDTLVDSQDGNIKGTTTKVIYNDLAFLVGLVEAVSESCGGRLVDHTHDVETSDGAGILGGGTLGVVEVGGDGNNSVDDLLAEVLLSDLLHLAKNHGRNLFGSESLVRAGKDVSLGIGDAKGFQLLTH